MDCLFSSRQKAFTCVFKQVKATVLANFNGPLKIFIDATVAKASNGNYFNDLLNVGTQQDNLKKFGKRLSLFVEQLITINTHILLENDLMLTHQCLLMLV